MTTLSEHDADRERAHEDLLEAITVIAIEAGARIMDIYERGFLVSFKPDASPLTEADTLAEALILDRLGAAFPDIPVIAEEAVANGHAPACGRLFFLVDPLDGSKEFIARNGEFTVNIALIADGVPVAGVVHAPAIGRIWWGGIGHGAWAGTVNAGQIVVPEAISTRLAPATGLTLVGSRSHCAEDGDARLAALEVAHFTTMGSSLKFCLLAEGNADIYPRFSRTMEWDTAAGDAILRAAGGRVLDLSGVPLRYGKRDQGHDSDFANGHFWAIGDGGHADLVVDKRGEHNPSE